MYHPYFRGKQNELITIRDTSQLLAASRFVPIIEPVKETMNGLKKALDAVVSAQGKAIVIVNPHHGELKTDGDNLSIWLAKHYGDEEGISAGILLKSGMSLKHAIEACNSHATHPISLIHAGFTDGKGLSEALNPKLKINCNAFFDPQIGKLYQKHFQNAPKILIRDGFKRRKNREYPTVEPFSDLHATFEMENMEGFGDFLVVGDDYSESGGPAFAIAIHLTFIDDDQDNAMFVYHFVSIRQDTSQDPAGKFGESLKKMVTRLDQRNSKVLETEAVQEFRELHKRQHFPGLGYVKKLSMQHHIETLAHFLSKAK